MSLTLAFAITLAASLPPDLVWYELGRRRGARVLGLLCRISLEPDSCVRRTETLFMARGRKALLIAKFLPGFSTIAPPLAGMVGIGRLQFITLDIAAAGLWAGAWMGLGYVFSDALEIVASHASRLGNSLGVVLGAALAGYILIKFVQRRRFLRSLRIARITPEDLKRRLDSGDETFAIIDTLHAGRDGGAVHDPGGAVDRRRGDRTTTQRAAARPRDRSLLFVTQRSDERPCGAAAEAKRYHARASTAWRPESLDGSRVPDHGAEAQREAGVAGEGRR